MKKSFTFLLVLVVSALNVIAQENPYKKETDNIFQAFKTKKFDLIKDYFTAETKIGTLPQGMAGMIVPQLLNQLPEPKDYKVTAVEKENGGTRVKTTYNYVNGMTREQSFLFNTDHKLLDFDVLGGVQTMTAEMPQAKNDVSFTMPFKLHRNVIYVKAKLNGKVENFIFDSGCPTLVLNSKHKGNKTDGAAGMEVRGIGGKNTTTTVDMESFEFGAIKLGKTKSIGMSMTHLEKTTFRRMAGIIGYSLFQNYEVTFDYENKLLTFTKLDKEGNPEGGNKAGEKYDSVKFNLVQHIPVFDIQVAGKPYKMGFDCGASTNLMYEKYIPEIKANLGKLKKVKMRGAGEKTVKAKRTKVQNITVSNVHLDAQKYAFEDATLDQINSAYGSGIDGLMGYELLKSHKVVVNYIKKVIKVY